MSPDTPGGKTLTPGQVQAQEHVAYIEPFYLLGEEAYVLTANRPHVQHLALRALIEGLGEQPQAHTIVMGYVGIRVCILPGTHFAGGQGSFPLAGICQDQWLFGWPGSRLIVQFADRHCLLQGFPLQLNDSLQVGPIFH